MADQKTVPGVVAKAPAKPAPQAPANPEPQGGSGLKPNSEVEGMEKLILLVNSWPEDDDPDRVVFGYGGYRITSHDLRLVVTGANVTTAKD